MNFVRHQAIWRLLLLIVTLVVALPSSAFDEPCNAEHFDQFFSRFSGDKDFSQKRTVWPLPVTTGGLDGASKKTIKLIRSGEEYWGTEKTVSVFLKENVRVRTYIDKKMKMRVVVTFAIEDGDILFNFKFKKQNGCWKLMEVYDFEH
jgi:hypothetical protein